MAARFTRRCAWEFRPFCIRRLDDECLSYRSWTDAFAWQLIFGNALRHAPCTTEKYFNNCVEIMTRGQYIPAKNGHLRDAQHGCRNVPTYAVTTLIVRLRSWETLLEIASLRVSTSLRNTERENVKVKEHKNCPDSLTFSREIQKRTRVRGDQEVVSLKLDLPARHRDAPHLATHHEELTKRESRYRG